ncbi:MAG: hypothetical protein FWF01_04585 [Alphaproteobacteria bacterium]|nr:hypothetical protein [Alphaproteobacteria bacterium]
MEILTAYGAGGSYNHEKSRIILRVSELSAEYAVGILQHEFIHLLIEEPIVQKYNIPQDLKERIVDIIGFEYFDIPVQKSFENSFANKYITKEAIETDLPDTVEKMMDDYNQRMS